MKSGFPLQMEISSILRKRGYEVFNGVYFFDNDQKKAREFDIEAILPQDAVFPSKFDLDAVWHVNPFVLIECKKSAVYSWVFFRSEPIALWLDIGQSIDILTEKRGYLKSCWGQMVPKGFLHYYKEDVVFVSAYKQVKLGKKPKNKGDGKDAILDAKSKIIKFMEYRLQDLKKFFAEDSPRKDIVFYFPLVVFDGELYEASFGENLKIREARHLIYETRYWSSLAKSLVPLYIDILRKDAFEEALSIIEKEVYNINEHMTKPESQHQLDVIRQKI